MYLSFSFVLSLFLLFGGFEEKGIRVPHYDGTLPVGDGIWIYLEKLLLWPVGPIYSGRGFGQKWQRSCSSEVEKQERV